MDAAPDIRTEQPGDRPGIRTVLEAAFPTAAEAALVDALRDGGHLHLSLVADLASEGVVGHVAFSPVEVEGARGGLGLAPLAVLTAHRRRGVGAALVRAGLEQCARAGVPFVVLLGSPAYYGRFGFRAARLFGVHDEYGGGDAFQALELQPDALAPAGGLVRYRPEFAAFG